MTTRDKDVLQLQWRKTNQIIGYVVFDHDDQDWKLRDTQVPISREELITLVRAMCQINAMGRQGDYCCMNQQKGKCFCARELSG
jgi:hypothetical protein